MTGDVNFDQYNNGRDLGGRQYIRIEGNTDITGDNYDDVFIIDDNPANSAYRLLYYLNFEGGTSPTLRDNGVRISPDDVLQYAGDFNGDGFDDLLLENEHTGYLGFLNSAENFNFVGIGKGSTDRVGNQWDVYGTGDMTNDGHDDIIWCNRANNAVGAWDMEFGAWTGWKFFGFGGENWHMETTGDFTGDGFNDILWRENTTGDTGIWDVYNEDGNWNWVYLGRPDWDWEIVQS